VASATAAATLAGTPQRSSTPCGRRRHSRRGRWHAAGLVRHCVPDLPSSGRGNGQRMTTFPAWGRHVGRVDLDGPRNLLFTRQARIVHGVLASVLLAAQVGWPVQPVRSRVAE